MLEIFLRPVAISTLVENLGHIITQFFLISSLKYNVWEM